MSEKRWYAVKTKYKCEKYVVNGLRKKGLEAWIPLVSMTRRYTRKVKTYDVPIINCYAFVRIDIEDKVKVLQSTYVQGFLQFSGVIVPIPDTEIELMRRVVGETYQVNASPTAWAEGDEVEVISGYLTGLKGILLSRKGKNQFVVRLETLGYDLEMDIDERLLRRVKRAEMAIWN